MPDSQPAPLPRFSFPGPGVLLKIPVLGCMLLTGPLSLNGEDPAPPFGFAPAEIFLSDFNTREIRIADFNQDGRVDIVVLNREKARLDFYFQNDPETGKTRTPQMHQDRWQPVLSHPRFTKESLIPGAQLQALEVGDFNQDGLIDIATVNEQNKLDIYHGPLAMSTKPSHRIEVAGHHGNIDCLKWHPEDNTLYYLGPELLEGFTWNQREQVYKKGKVAHLPRGQNPSRLRFVDLNRNGQSDLIYELGDPDYGLAVHLRVNGEWMPMQRPLLEPASASFIPGEGPGSLFALHNNSGAIVAFDFMAVPGKENPRPVSIDEVHLPAFRQAQFVSFVGEPGLETLLIFPPGHSEIQQLNVDESGQLGFPEARAVPSGCQWILKGRFLPEILPEAPGKPQLLIHNPKTLYLGLMSFEAGKIQFPVSLPNDAALICAETWRPEGAEQDQILGIVREDSRKLSLKRWRVVQDGDRHSLEELQHLDLEHLKRDPEGLFPLPSEEGRPEGFLVTNPLGESFYLFAEPDASGNLSVVQPPKGFSSEQLKMKRLQNFRRYPSIPNLPSPMAYVDAGQIQFYSVNAQGVLRLVQQINCREIAAVQDVLPLDPSGERLALISTSGREVEIHRYTAAGGYVAEKTFTFPAGSFHSSQLIRLPAAEGRQEGPWELLLLGNQQLRRVFPRPDPWQLQSQTVYQSDLPDYWPDVMYRGDFNGDGKQDLLLLEQVKHHMFEILTQRDGDWRSVLHFPVFEASPGPQRNSGGVSEPRETRIADINGDGLDDVIMLVHDRLLLYLQDEMPAAQQPE